MILLKHHSKCNEGGLINKKSDPLLWWSDFFLAMANALHYELQQQLIVGNRIVSCCTSRVSIRDSALHFGRAAGHCIDSRNILIRINTS